MPTSAADVGEADGLKALLYLKSTEPPLYLAPSPELSKAARLASQYLFSTLNPYAPKSPFSQLLTEGFDAEQIWQQIDLQSQPLLNTLRRQVRYLEKNPQEIEKQLDIKRKEEDNGVEDRYDLENGLNKEICASESESEGLDDDDHDDEDMEDCEEEEEAEAEENADDHEEGERGNVNGVEDEFLKIKEMQEYLEADEAREYGLEKKKKKKKMKKKRGDDTDEEEGEDEDKDDEDELGIMGLDDDDYDEDGEATENARYEDFFASQRSTRKRKLKTFSRSDAFDMSDEPSDDNDDHGGLDDMDTDGEPNDSNEEDQNKQSLSTFEKERQKLQSEIKELERANLEPKTWTMQGEVTAAKRPKNSALEVDLDFEHNVRPAPVITEEVTASLEELIQKRVLEGQFDDVQKPPTLPNKAPREKVELDENKSKKGLAELYEDEYAQKTGLVSKALTFSDERKKEASMVFKKLCVKLDALSHFHFTPKPVIEDMSVQSNVPALVMEEIAPLAVSDVAMLAPEEVFAGKGDIKEETELTKAERKRRRANKKRKFKAKASKRTATKAQQNSSMNDSKGNEDS